ncbi:MAG: GWxTD domain-containing protein [Candidatus Zixiibacteriota bacterium]
MRVMRWMLVFWIGLTLTPVGTPAQTDFGYIAENNPVFFVDYASFREETGEKLRLEVYYKILTRGLTFIKNEGKFKASYEIEIFVSNKINKQVSGTSLEEDYLVNSYEETQSPLDFLTNQINLSLYSGRYKLKVRFIDHNSGSSLEQERDLNIPSRSEKRVLFSDVEFIRRLSDALSPGLDSAKMSRFGKNGEIAIPCVSRGYGDSDPTLLFYYEIYNAPQAPQPYRLIYGVEHLGQAFSRHETTTVTLGPQTYSAFDSISLAGFPAGDYSLTISLVDNGQVKAKVERPFRIDWSLFRSLKNDYSKAVDQLKYVASPQEMKKLKEAPDSERVEKWLEFWKSKDPTPNTPENEIKDEYYRRLAYVSENFSLPTKEGWETDMGMVYMIYGHPDDVEKHPFDRDVQAFQEWYYYKSNRVFLFIDRGDGEYELQPPYDGKYRSY